MAGKAKMGRPRIDIDVEQFEKLCHIQCTLKEIACFFRCSEDTIERWCKREYKQTFADVFDTKRQMGFISLRRETFKRAMNGSDAVLIFSLKNMLGWTDKQELSAGGDKPFVFNYKLD